MKIVDAFWLGNIGFVKVDNGFEVRVFVGPMQGINEQEDAQWIATYGTRVPSVSLSQFLEIDRYKSEYTTE